MEEAGDQGDDHMDVAFEMNLGGSEPEDPAATSDDPFDWRTQLRVDCITLKESRWRDETISWHEDLPEIHLEPPAELGHAMEP